MYEKFEDTKGVNKIRRRSDNTMAKKAKQCLTKYYMENQRLSNTNPTKHRGWTQMLRKDKQFLLDKWHSLTFLNHFHLYILYGLVAQQ